MTGAAETSTAACLPRKAQAAAIRDFLVVWVVPLFPLLFLGWGIPGTDRTVSVPKALLPAVVGLWAYTFERKDFRALNCLPFWTFSCYLAWITLSVGLAREHNYWVFWHYAQELLYVLFLAAAWSRPPTNGRRFWLNLEVVCILISAWAVLLVAVGRPPITALPYQLIGTPNVAAAFLVLAWLRAMHTRRWWHSAVFLTGVMALRSYGAVLALLFGLCALIRSRTARAAIIVGVLGTGVILVGLNWSDSVATGRGGYRWPGPPNTFWNSSVQPRLYVGRIALTEIAREPRFGTGLGTFPEAFLAAERRAVTEDQMPWWRFGYPPKDPVGMSAHNDALRIAMEAGVPAALIWLVACFGILWEVRQRPVARACVIGFLTQAMTDNLYILSNYIPVLWTAVRLDNEMGFRGRMDGKIRD